MKDRKPNNLLNPAYVRQILESGLKNMEPVVDVVAMSEIEAGVYRSVYREMVSERVACKEKLDQITEFGFLIRIGD